MSKLLSHLENASKLLGSLNALQALIAGASACERMYPLYAYYASRVDEKSLSYVRESLDQIWSYLAHHKEAPASVPSFDLNAALLPVFRGDPSPWMSGAADDELIELLGGEAGNACLSVCSALDSLYQIYKSQRVESLNNIFEQSLNIADALVYDHLKLNPTTENDNEVESHPVIENEMKRQLRDISRVELRVSPDDIRQIRIRAQREPLHADLLFG